MGQHARKLRRTAGKVLHWPWPRNAKASGFDDLLVLAGQRISHGTVSETILLEKGRWCRGIGMKQADIRAKSPIGTYKTEVLQCRDVCYADSACSIWEHSTRDGCWYGYSDECSRSFPEAATMVEGERVARACGPECRQRKQLTTSRSFDHWVRGFSALLLRSVDRWLWGSYWFS